MLFYRGVKVMKKGPWHTNFVHVTKSPNACLFPWLCLHELAFWHNTKRSKLDLFSQRSCGVCLRRFSSIYLSRAKLWKAQSWFVTESGLDRWLSLKASLPIWVITWSGDWRSFYWDPGICTECCLEILLQIIFKSVCWTKFY